MRVTWGFLTRQGPCPPLIALLLTCSVAACATPFSNNTTPLAQNTPIVYADDSGNLQAISGRDGSPLWHTSVWELHQRKSSLAMQFTLRCSPPQSRCA